MVIPDVNLLVYAYNADAPLHASAKTWWEELLNSTEQVGLPWITASGFIRVTTHPRVFLRPMSPGEAIDAIRSWLEMPCVSVLDPGPRHLDLLETLLGQIGVAGRMTTDAQLAALAVEYQATLASTDVDFSRFSGLRWHNPLVDRTRPARLRHGN